LINAELKPIKLLGGEGEYKTSSQKGTFIDDVMQIWEISDPPLPLLQKKCPFAYLFNHIGTHPSPHLGIWCHL
jgi:hypothetical protein